MDAIEKSLNEIEARMRVLRQELLRLEAAREALRKLVSPGKSVPAPKPAAGNRKPGRPIDPESRRAVAAVLHNNGAMIGGKIAVLLGYHRNSVNRILRMESDLFVQTSDQLWTLTEKGVALANGGAENKSHSLPSKTA